MKNQLIHIVPSKRWLACGDTTIVSRELSLEQTIGFTYNQIGRGVS